MQTAEAKAIYKKRAEVAEFPNAWIKDKFGLRQFHLRGTHQGGDGGPLGLPHLQYQTLDQALLETAVLGSDIG